MRVHFIKTFLSKVRVQGLRARVRRDPKGPCGRMLLRARGGWRVAGFGGGSGDFFELAAERADEGAEVVRDVDRVYERARRSLRIRIIDPGRVFSRIFLTRARLALGRLG